MPSLNDPSVQRRVNLALVALAAAAAAYLLGRPLLAVAAWPSDSLRRFAGR
jgi:hypothetical protein